MAAYSYEYVHGAIGCDQKNLYTSVAVTTAPVRVPTQRPLVLRLTSVVDLAENFSPYLYSAADVHGAMGCYQKKLYTSVAVTTAPAWFLTQQPLVLSGH